MYGTTDGVIGRTGVKPKDLGVDTDSDLDALISGWLVQINDLINQDRKRDFENPGPVPPGIILAAELAASRLVSHAVVTRQTPVVRVDDFKVQLPDAVLLSGDVRRILRRYPKPGESSLGMFTTEKPPDTTA